MKKILLIVTFFMFSVDLFSQKNNGWGAKIGLSYNINSSAKFDEGAKVFSGKKQSTGYLLGVFYKTQNYEYGLYFQPEFIYSRYTNEISRVKKKDGYLLETSNLNENNFEINLLLGKSFAKIIKLKAGPSGIWSMNTENDNIKTEFKNFRLGYQIGGAIEVGPVSFDIAYRGSFSGNNGYINLIDGHKIDLDQRLSQFIITLGVRL